MFGIGEKAERTVPTGQIDNSTSRRFLQQRKHCLRYAEDSKNICLKRFPEDIHS